MKKLRCIKLLSVVLLSSAVTAGCAGQSAKDSASKAAPEARQAIKNASDSISMANANNWIWSNTEDLLKEAQAAADGGDNAKAIKLADQAKFQAEAAIIQYNYEKDHPRGL
jgi:hypothetical protein